MLKTMNKKLALVLIVFSIGYLFMSVRLPSYPYVPVDADAVPITLGLILLVLSIALFFSKDQQEHKEESKPSISKKDIMSLLYVFVFILLYIWLLEILGFAIVTALFIFCCSWVLGYKKHVTNLIVSVAVPFLFYYLFNYLLQINLPQGILPF